MMATLSNRLRKMVLISLDDARNCTGFSDHSLLYADEVAELEAEIARLRGAASELLSYCESSDPDPDGFLDAINEARAACTEAPRSALDTPIGGEGV